MATISEVAERAGVSVKTVSRVLNNYAHISAKTREKVEAAMSALDYQPSAIARQMRLGANPSIGMLYSDPQSGYQARLNYHVLKACADVQRYLVVELFDEDHEDWCQQVGNFLDRTKVTNLILVPPMCDADDIRAMLTKRDIRAVLISPSRQTPDFPSISMDDRSAAEEAVKFLVSLGHKRIGHISGHPDHIATLHRRRGYEEALRKAGLSGGNDRLIEAGLFDFEAAMNGAERLLGRDDRPTAIFAANDEMAAAVLMAATRLGLRVPDDLAIIGHDDTAIAQIISPKLTTIAQPFELIAKTALDFLGDGSRNGHTRAIKHKILPHKLIKRHSTASAQ